MKKICTYFILPICFLLAVSTASQAQKRVKGKPLNYVMPVDYFDNSSAYQKFLESTSPKSKDNGWLVFSDRNNNDVYDKPNGSVTRQINFRDNFFVVDEKGGWIKIATARVDALKIVKGSKEIIGWVPKHKMLLWNSGVIGQVTRIHKKILLLNRADQIDEILLKKDKELVKIYADPEKKVEEKNRKIFEYFFMLKKENDMYLIAEDVIISPYAPEKIIGWVSARDCDVWDTRICLEPNFKQEAYSERHVNKELRICAYESQIGAENGIKGIGKESQIFWKNDPVNLKDSEKAKSNSRRFLGSVIRFPMVNVSGGPGSEIYKSGIVGTIKLKARDGKLIRDIEENKMAQLEKQLNKLESKSTKVNIYYVIEGTDYSFPYKQAIIQSMKGVHKDLAKRNLVQVKYGAMIYRDLPEESDNRLTEHSPLSSDIDKLTNFVQQSDFKNKVDRDEYTAMYYGLNQALQKGGFKSDKKESELNIIILLGCFGDFRSDRDRRTAAKDHPAFFDSDKIDRLIANLNGIDAHLYAIQLANDGYRPALSYSKAGQYLILENAKIAYNKQQRRIDAKLSSQLKEYGYVNYKEGPSLELDNAQQVSSMQKGVVPGSVVRPVSNDELSTEVLSNQIRKNVSTSIEHVTKLKKAVSKIITEGDIGKLQDLASDVEVNPEHAGEFEASVLDVLIEILEDNPSVALPDVLDEKYKLFTEVYIPYKYPNAIHPLVSYVLFMPESDLIDYTRNIERCQALLSETSYDKKREGLFDVYKALLDQFTGSGASFKKRVDDVTIADVQRLMNGVYTSGLRLDPDKELKIVEIQDERKVPNERVDELIKNFTEVEKKLSGILRDADTYDFCYKTDDFNRYYWIPIEDTF